MALKICLRASLCWISLRPLSHSSQIKVSSRRIGKARVGIPMGSEGLFFSFLFF